MSGYFPEGPVEHAEASPVEPVESSTAKAVPVLVPDSIAKHMRFSAWKFSFSETFRRDPFNTDSPDVIANDAANFWAWVESDSKTTAEQEKIMKEALQHPLWKEYCLDSIQAGAQDALYYDGSGISDIEDLSAEVEAWKTFLTKKGTQATAIPPTSSTVASMAATWNLKQKMS